MHTSFFAELFTVHMQCIQVTGKFHLNSCENGDCRTQTLVCTNLSSLIEEDNGLGLFLSFDGHNPGHENTVEIFMYI